MWVTVTEGFYCAGFSWLGLPEGEREGYSGDELEVFLLHQSHLGTQGHPGRHSRADCRLKC